MRTIHKVIHSEKQVEELIQHILETGMCSFDFETSSLKYYEDTEYPTIISISFQVGSSWIIPLGHFESPFKDSYVKILKRLGTTVFENPNIIKVGWNLKYEYKWLLKYGINCMGRVFDAMLAKYPLDEERPHGLKENTALLLPDFAGYELPGSGSDKFNWAAVPLDKLCEYGGHDSDNTLRLFLFYEKKLMAHNFYNLYRNMFCMLIRVLGKTEFMGVPIDKPYLEKLMAEYKEKIEDNELSLRNIPAVRRYQKKVVKQKLNRYIEKLEKEKEDFEERGDTRGVQARQNRIKAVMAGNYSNKEERAIVEPINFESTPQMASLLYTSEFGFNLPIIEKTESGAPSSKEETLIKLKPKDKSGFLEALLKSRELRKLDSTYITGIYNQLSSNGRIHCSYKINGTVTGRLCISEKGYLYTDKGKISIKHFCPKGVGTMEVEGIKVLTHTGRYKPIVKGINKGEEEMYKVTLEDGKNIECTLNHIFLTDKGWVPLLEILNNTNDYLIKTL